MPKKLTLVRIYSSEREVIGFDTLRYQCKNPLLAKIDILFIIFGSEFFEVSSKQIHWKPGNLNPDDPRVRLIQQAFV